MEIDTRKLFEVNDILYKISRLKGEGPFEVKIVEVEYYKHDYDAGWHYMYRDNLGNTFFYKALNHTYFKTKEEALETLENIKKASKKRQLLKEYEAKLNEELQLKNHIIVK